MTATTFAAPQAPARKPNWRFDYAKLVDAVFWLTICSGSIVLVEPAPYDMLILFTLALWAFGGFSLHKAVLPFVVLISLWTFGGFIALIPYWNETEPVGFMFHSLYLALTGVFFALLLSQRTTRRVDLLLNAYATSAVIAACIAVASWFGLFGDKQDWIPDGRAMAPFKDPNVLGSYLVLAVLFLTQNLLLDPWRKAWLLLPSLAVIVAALFLSFSRGAWAAAIVALTLLGGFLIRTADSAAMRRRILAGAAGFVLLASAALIGALSVDSLRAFFVERVVLTQDYDEGPNGRFGNQLRAIPPLLEKPLGFGPLRFRLTFGLEPHNSYLNAFASNGWLGGFSFILLALTSCFVGFRLCLTRHPWMRQAQVLFAATFVYFLQGLQIDLDHWRMFYLALGAVWGLEAARRRWLKAALEPQPGTGQKDFCADS